MTAHLHGKRGRPADPARVAIRRLFSEMSDRTFATYWCAYSTLAATEGRAGLETATRAATRANGSFNVAEFSRHAERAAMRAADREAHQ